MTFFGSADLHLGMVARWNTSGLNKAFTDLWAVADRSKFVPLVEAMVPKGTPLPYCVFEQEPSITIARMSGRTGSGSKFENRDVPWQFRIHAQQRSLAGDNRDAKTVAADLMGLILGEFGGHPETAPNPIPLEHGGCVLNLQYETDYGVKEDEKVYLWIIRYIAKIDVPVTTG